jgi:hypothetical protein
VFRFGRARSAPAPRQSMRYYEAPPRRRGSFFGGLLRLIFSAAGGIALAYAVAPFIFGRSFRDYGDYDRYDRFDGFGGLEGILNHTPMLILTVVATIIVWAFLSALTRR